MEKFIVFDCDGTLLDTLPGIKEALNATLKELNFNYEYNLDEVKNFIGGGVKRLFKLGLKRDFSDNELNLMLSNYKKYQYLAKPYENVIETLNYLKDKGIKLFVYSNKPHNLLLEVIKINFLSNLFIEIQGDDFFYKRKPDPEYLENLFKKYNLNPMEGFYMGDSIFDLETARNAKLKSIIYTNGFGNYEEIKKENPDYMISDFKDLKEIIK